MPKVCYYKIVRDPPRRFTVEDAARVCCYVLRDGATWSEIKERVAARSCISPEKCDCDQTNSIIQMAIELAAVVSVALGLLIPAFRAIGFSIQVYRSIQRIQGQSAADSYLNLQRNVKSLEDMSGEVEPWLEMQYNQSTGLWEKVPAAPEPINIRP